MFRIKKDGSGIFSNFLRVIDWLWYSEYTGESVCFDWKEGQNDLFDGILNIKGTCEKPEYETSNWVEFCNLQLNEKIELRRSKIPFYRKEKYYSKGYFYTTPDIYKEEHFNLLRNELYNVFTKRIEFCEDFLKLPQTNLLKREERNLGVHIRSMQHYLQNDHHNGNTLNLNIVEFYKQNAHFVMQEFFEGKYDKVYIACDISDFIEEVKALIPEEKIVFINYTRGNNNQDWKDKYRKESYDSFVEMKNCFIDAYNLSQCNHFIMSVSNIAFGVLIFNPNIEYKMFPMLENLYGK